MTRVRVPGPAALALLGVASLALAACSGSSSASTPAASAPTPSTTSGTRAPVCPRAIDTGEGLDPDPASPAGSGLQESSPSWFGFSPPNVDVGVSVGFVLDTDGKRGATEVYVERQTTLCHDRPTVPSPAISVVRIATRRDVRIESASGHVLTIGATGGAKWTFDVDSLRLTPVH